MGAVMQTPRGQQRCVPACMPSQRCAQRCPLMLPCPCPPLPCLLTGEVVRAKSCIARGEVHTRALLHGAHDVTGPLHDAAVNARLQSQQARDELCSRLGVNTAPMLRSISVGSLRNALASASAYAPLTSVQPDGAAACAAVRDTVALPALVYSSASYDAVLEARVSRLHACMHARRRA